MGRNLNEKHPAKNIGANPPTKRHDFADGSHRIEKLCPIPLNRKMLDPDGNVVTVALANGYAIKRMDAYGHRILAEKLKAGFLPYDECPVATGRVKHDPKKDAPCEGKFSKDKACKHIEQILKVRRTAKQKLEAEIQRAYSTNQDKMIALLLEQNKILNRSEEKTGESALAR
jgi:hypothetical protein